MRAEDWNANEIKCQAKLIRNRIARIIIELNTNDK